MGILITFRKTLLAAIIFLTGLFTPHQTAETPLQAKETPKTTVASTTPKIPSVLQKISWCESRNRQFNKDGSVYRGEINPQDVGKYQINEHYWLETSKKLGFDIYTEAGNEAMALWIYERSGSQPWFWSEHCWGKKE